MKGLGRLTALVSSWWLTALLVTALWAGYLAFSPGKNPFPSWVAFLFHQSAGQAIYLLLIVNIFSASVRIILSRIRRPPLSPGYIRSLDMHLSVPAEDAVAFREAAAASGIPAVPEDPVTGGRNLSGAWSFLPGTFFRLGLVMTLISLLIVSRSRLTEDVSLHEGEGKKLLGSTVYLDDISAELPPDYLQVGDEGTLLLPGVSARITTEGRSATITPGFPTRLLGRWYRIRHLGYSQAMTVVHRGSKYELIADLDVLPPGRHSIVSLPSGSVFLTFSLDPDRTITKGLLTGRQYNLRHPSYRVLAQEGKPRESAAGIRMKPGDRRAAGPTTVTLGDRRLSLRLQAVADAGLYPLYAGMIVLLAGLCGLASRFFWYEREIAFLEKDGEILIGTRDEFFKKWGIERFQRLTSGFAERNLP